MLEWNKASEKQPKGHPSFGIDIMVRIYGLASITASEYHECKVIKWYGKNKEFGEFERNYNGDIEYISYGYGDEDNMPYPCKMPFVTHWAYFNNVDGI